MRKNFGAKPFLYPQPVMILGTYDENGKANAMNAAWGGIVGANEIIVDLSAHKTTDNIIINKAFTVGVADLEHLVACDYVGIVSANKEADKMQKAGFTTTKSGYVNAPVINELPLTLECELVKVIDGSKYLAEIKNVSADEKYLGDDGEIDLSKFTPITYDPVHHGYYRLGERVGNAFKDDKKFKDRDIAEGDLFRVNGCVVLGGDLTEDQDQNRQNHRHDADHIAAKAVCKCGCKGRS